ncbi:MAG TPA: GNAT family N-acetyltransferase [Alphaproteobacteria bacterium]|nr:GNAT family N-acetyltransferase [Alphaproteobacteria bacterium]USO05014.1 MAG: GNAT family N-acetyltransferase [Rhodospirillales bacterium]HOO81893.1 GNAT family N-acetyltransferase [Alphaproteobacteria bacterium]
MAVKIRAIENRDFPDWLPLWNGNNLGMRDEAVTSETWSRLIDPNSKVCGLVAEKDGALVGLVHYILHPTTGSLHDVCYMQDVFVSPDARREGIAKKLITYISQIGKREKWARIYWLAESNNAAAQSLYRALGQKLDFTLHVMKLD